MTYDLEILKELSLPLLEELAPRSAILNENMSRGKVFWVEFNSALLGAPGQVMQLLARYKITIEQHAGKFESLKAEYLAVLAQHYCAGQVSPSVTLLLDKGDAAFIDEVAFQKDMLAAMTLAGRAAIKNELNLSDEFAGADISDEEITGAFSTLDRDATRKELRKQLQEIEEEQEPETKPKKRKRIGAIPFLMLRIAAAAAVGTVVTMEVVNVYNGRNKQEALFVKPASGVDSNKLAGHSVAIDEAGKADSLRPNTAVTVNDHDTTKANAAHLYIVLKGTAVDTVGNEVLRDVAITMVDDKGKEHTVFSKDGKFRLRLPLHRDFVITGKKEGYHSARLSLSTMDAKETDAGDVIEVVLRFSKDQ